MIRSREQKCDHRPKASAVFDLGARVRRHRLALGLSQEALARRAGLSQPHVQMIEAGKRRHPQFRTVERLADALGLPVESLTESPKRKTEMPDRLKEFLSKKKGDVSASEINKLLKAPLVLGFMPSPETYGKLLRLIRLGH